MLIVLCACTNLPPRAVEYGVWDEQRVLIEALNAWQLGGRVNVRYEGESHTPRIRWQQQDNEYAIRLWGTFNAGNTRIIGGPGYVTMEHDGDVHTASSPEDLILQQLGYELPVSYLEFWIRGLPAPDSKAELTFNELNQLSEISQDGWTVVYPDPRQYGALTLPRRVDVSRPEDSIVLRFIGLNWNVVESLN